MEMKYNPENNIFCYKDIEPGNVTIISNEIYGKIRDSIRTIAEEYKIRLTPEEFKILENNYIERYVNNVDISSLIQLSENIKRRNSI